MAHALTLAQKRLLDMIRAHIATTGVAPSFDEMRLAMGIRSKSTIHHTLTRLEERGAIRRRPAHARAIEVVDPDDALAAENARLRTALSECLGQLTGGMDGTWTEDSDPIAMARAALAEKGCAT